MLSPAHVWLILEPMDMRLGIDDLSTHAHTRRVRHRAPAPLMLSVIADAIASSFYRRTGPVFGSASGGCMKATLYGLSPPKQFSH